MPALVRLYIKNVLFGFALSAAFVTALLFLNVANLWHLISASPGGWIALTMLFMFNGIVFAGVQFAIAIMRMEDKGERGDKGRRIPIATSRPAVAHATATGQDREARR